MTSFKTLGLAESVVNGALSAGYDTPTPIQSNAIPIALDGHDLIGCAQTGTGKTAAFVLPMLDAMVRENGSGRNRSIRALVVVPTRELALQVEEATRIYGRHTRLRSIAVFGGVGIQPQTQKLRRGVDIVVATPGRLLDHMDRGNIDLSEIEMLVLDEADRMLDMGFIHDIRKIVAASPRDRQTMFFSATMPSAVQELANSILHNPKYIEMGQRRNPAESVMQQVCSVKQADKMNLLVYVLETEAIENVIVFSRTKHRADRIARKLVRKGFSTTVLHSNRSQSQREKALNGFKAGRFQILVATNIAARGIDVDSVSHVINYDTPQQAEDYIHRIGRTGRADATGDAITFVGEGELPYLKDIERHTGKRLDRLEVEGLTVSPGDPAMMVAANSKGTRSSGKSRNGRSRNGNRRNGTSSTRKSSNASRSRNRKAA